MAKKLIRRFLPDAHKIRDHKHLRVFGTLLHDPNIWHLNRHSVAGAFAVGLFMAFVPMPLQMIPAAALMALTSNEPSRNGFQTRTNSVVIHSHEI